MPEQGHFCPMKMSGDKDEWKNDQKNDKKKKTSEVINSIIPNFNPLITSLVCRFSKVDSRITSRHQLKEIKIIKVMFKKIFILSIFPLNSIALENTILNNCKDPKIGHGLGETKLKLKGETLLLIFFFEDPRIK